MQTQKDMQDIHPFIMTPSTWQGEGVIEMNLLDKPMHYLSDWIVAPKNSAGKIECRQEFRVKGIPQLLTNQFFFYKVRYRSFLIELENKLIGKIVGEGFWDDKVIAWEFLAVEAGFEGFEFYEKENEKLYQMRAEYVTTDHLRTNLSGTIYKRR